eukprot:GSMAST32.ASY1.ANO1.441.1 assembled CDS
MSVRARTLSQPKRSIAKVTYAKKLLLAFRGLKQLQVLPDKIAEGGKYSISNAPVTSPQNPRMVSRNRPSDSEQDRRGGQSHSYSKRRGPRDSPAGWSRGAKAPSQRHNKGRHKKNDYYSDPDVSGYVLKTNENPWTREKAASDGVEACHKLMISLLNKLTREKFDRITRQILDIDFTTRPQLKRMIYCIFDKALMEPHFSELYADVCVELARVSEEHAMKAGKKLSSFKRILLNKCQEECMFFFFSVSIFFFLVSYEILYLTNFTFFFEIFFQNTFPP